MDANAEVKALAEEARFAADYLAERGLFPHVVALLLRMQHASRVVAPPALREPAGLRCVTVVTRHLATEPSFLDASSYEEFYLYGGETAALYRFRKP